MIGNLSERLKAIGSVGVPEYFGLRRLADPVPISKGGDLLVGIEWASDYILKMVWRRQLPLGRF